MKKDGDEIRQSLCEALVKLEEARRLIAENALLPEHTRAAFLGVAATVEERAHA